MDIPCWIIYCTRKIIKIKKDDHKQIKLHFLEKLYR